MKIIYFGNGPRGLKCLEKIYPKHEILAVVAHDIKDSEVASFAKKKKIPCLQTDKINSNKSENWLNSFEADIFILSGFNKIIKKNIISIPAKGCINLHGGKLPEYRGTAPINWQIIKGESEGGACILYVDEGIDTGDILKQVKYKIKKSDTANDILKKQLQIFPKMLLEVLDNISDNTIVAKKQNLKDGKYYTRRYPWDSKIDWTNLTAVEVHNLVRASSFPYPNAFSFKKGDKIYIVETAILDKEIIGIPGRIPLKFKDGVVVLAKDKGLLIKKILVNNSDKIINPINYFKIGDNLN